jgi:hypothetical protein
MSRIRSFQTAAARRRNDPIIWDIDGEQIKLVATLELADLADLIEALQADPEDNANSIRVAVEKRKLLLDIVERFIIDEDRANFKKVADDLDIHILSQMVQELIGEYAGSANPTKPSSSSAGSQTDGETSTDGVQPEGSTL